MAFVTVVCLLSRVQLFLESRDCSLPGYIVHGILQARVLEWVAISFSRGSSRPRDQTHLSCTGRQIFFFLMLNQQESPQMTLYLLILKNKKNQPQSHYLGKVLHVQ